ncbi:hypothetical protein PG993_005205 [Apiospora rasikravindrae]|uniref:Uncharacterized protein n=1 Tax=Apiospora rasikravindrae TaxID=990691 RepID=A0ABR1TEX6_9PEZI
MRHLALPGIFAALLRSASAQQYGGSGGSGSPGGPGGPGISITGGGGTCPFAEPTTVFVTVTPDVVVIPPPSTVTVTVPNPPFGYTSGVSAQPGPQWPSGWPPAESLTVPCTTGPNGEPLPSVPGLVTVTYPGPPGGSPGVGTFSLVTVPPASQTGYPGGPFGVSSSPGGPGGQGMSSIPGWGSFGSSPEPTVTVTVPEGTPAGPWGSETNNNPGGPPGGQGGSGSFTNPYALPTVTLTVPEGGSGGSTVPGGGSPGSDGGQDCTTSPEGGVGPSNPFPEVTVTAPPNGQPSAAPGGPGGQGWSSTPDGGWGPSYPFPEVTVTVPPNGQPSSYPGGPGWSSTPGGGWGSAPPGGGFGPSNTLPEITITLPYTTLTVPYTVPNGPGKGETSSTPQGGYGGAPPYPTVTLSTVGVSPGGGFGPSNTLPEITLTLPDTTLTIPYTIPNGPGNGEASSTPQGGYGGALPTPTVILSTIGVTPGGGSPGGPGGSGGSASQTFSGGYGWPSPSTGPGGQGQGSGPSTLTITIPNTGSGEGYQTTPALISPIVSTLSGTITSIVPSIPWTPIATPPGLGSATFSTPCPEELTTPGQPGIPWTYSSYTESTPTVVTMWPPATESIPSVVTIWPVSTEETPSLITIWPSIETIWPSNSGGTGPSGQGMGSTSCPEDEGTDVGRIGATSTTTLASSSTSTLILSSTSTSTAQSSDAGAIGETSTSSIASSSTSTSASTATDQTSSAGPCDGSLIKYYITSLIISDDLVVSVDISTHVHCPFIVQRLNQQQLEYQFLYELVLFQQCHLYHFGIVTFCTVVAVLVACGHFKFVEHCGDYYKLPISNHQLVNCIITVI